MSVVGVPDWQQGVVGAQYLLAGPISVDGPETINVPVNCETMILVASGGTEDPSFIVEGTTTGLRYPTVLVKEQLSGLKSYMYYVPVIESVDAAYSVEANTLSGGTWWAISDNFVRVLTDSAADQILQSLHIDATGLLYTVPSAPDTVNDDPPPNELQIAQLNASVGTGGTAIVAAPGGGKSIRLFYAKLLTWGASITDGASINITFKGAGIGVCYSGYLSLPESDIFVAPLTGILCDADTPVIASAVTSTQSVVATVVYTIQAGY